MQKGKRTSKNSENVWTGVLSCTVSQEGCNGRVFFLFNSVQHNTNFNDPDTERFINIVGKGEILYLDLCLVQNTFSCF